MRLPGGRGLHPHPHRVSADTVRWECAWQGEEEGKGQFDWSWVNGREGQKMEQRDTRRWGRGGGRSL